MRNPRCRRGRWGDCSSGHFGGHSSVGGSELDDMSVAESQPVAPMPKLRRLWPTPGWLVVGLLVVECLLWLSERFGWPAWHKGYAVLAAVASVAVVMLLMLLSFVASLLFRWRFQFSVRSLLVLVVAVALPFIDLRIANEPCRPEQACAVPALMPIRAGTDPLRGYPEACSGLRPCHTTHGLIFNAKINNWLAVELRRARQQREALAGIEKLGGIVTSSTKRPVGGPRLPSQVLLPLVYTDPSGPAWLRCLLGEDFFQTVRAVDFETGEVTDEWLEHLKRVNQLQQVVLRQTAVTDAGLENLSALDQLETLDLGWTEITDAGLVHLQGLTRLQWLDLSGTEITDAGLVHLQGLTRLQWLDLTNTKVTDEGVKKLQQALRSCKIRTDVLSESWRDGRMSEAKKRHH